MSSSAFGNFVEPSQIYCTTCLIFLSETSLGSRAGQLIACVLVQEDGVNLLTIIKGTCKYRLSRRHDFVMDFLPPSASEFKQELKKNGYVGTFINKFLDAVLFVL